MFQHYIPVPVVFTNYSTSNLSTGTGKAFQATLEIEIPFEINFFNKKFLYTG
jgi:hypothetical protein